MAVLSDFYALVHDDFPLNRLHTRGLGNLKSKVRVISADVTRILRRLFTEKLQEQSSLSYEPKIGFCPVIIIIARVCNIKVKGAFKDSYRFFIFIFFSLT